MVTYDRSLSEDEGMPKIGDIELSLVGKQSLVKMSAHVKYLVLFLNESERSSIKH